MSTTRASRAGVGDGEAGVAHVVGVGGAVGAEGAQEGEHVLADDCEHLGGLAVGEVGPAQVLVVAAARIEAGGEQRAFERAFGAGGLALLQFLQLVQTADEEEVGDLLDDLERVGNAAGPEGVPDLVDLAAYCSCQHRARPGCCGESWLIRLACATAQRVRGGRAFRIPPVLFSAALVRHSQSRLG